MPVVQGSAFGIFHNQRQVCIAASRLIVHESVADELLERFTSLARSIRIGDPLDPSTEMGSLMSQMHRDRVLSYVNIAREQGGRVLAGGKSPDAATLAKGLLCRADDRAGEADGSHRAGGSIRAVRHREHVQV